MIIDGPLQKEYRKESIQFWLDEMKVQNITYMNSSVLSLFSTGRTRGLTLEIGDGVCSAVPIFEGYGLPHAVRQLSFGGYDLTQYIHQQLINRGLPLSEKQWFVSQCIKEKMLRVPKDHEGLNGSDPLDEEQKSFELPDGSIIQVDKDIRTVASEALFYPKDIIQKLKNPQIDGSEGIIDIGIDCINLCDNDLKQELLSNIVLSGGSTMIPGFQDRVEKELLKQLPKSVNRQDVQVLAYSTRKYGAWVGGSMVASLATFTDQAISKTEYDDKGDHKFLIALEKTF